MDTIQSINYPIFFNDSITQLVNFVKQGNYSRFFILTDENTAKYCLPLVKEQLGDIDDYDLIEINSGEESKDIDFCIGIWKMLIDFGADRKSLLVNLGGGVISDMGGFAASTFKRGIDFDSIKNIIGTFTQPKAVFIAYDFLKTLPARQILSGLAEMLKHGLIMDAAYWDALKNSDLTRPSAELIYKSVELKNQVVTDDPHEKGVRKALNFGH